MTGFVYIIDDSADIRAFLSALLASVSIPSRIFASGIDFLQAVNRAYAGCILMDVRMPGMSGLEVVTHLRRRDLRLPVILMSGFADVPMVIKAMKLGAVDFIEKPFNSTDLLERLQQALAQDAAERVAQEETGSFRQKLDALSRRERQVLDLVLAGRKNKEIASDLDISKRTVETHRSSIMKKLGCGSLVELVQAASTLAAPLQPPPAPGKEDP